MTDSRERLRLRVKPLPSQVSKMSSTSSTGVKPDTEKALKISTNMLAAFKKVVPQIPTKFKSSVQVLPGNKSPQSVPTRKGQPRNNGHSTPQIAKRPTRLLAQETSVRGHVSVKVSSQLSQVSTKTLDVRSQSHLSNGARLTIPSPEAKSGGVVFASAIAAALTARINQLPIPQDVRRFQPHRPKRRRRPSTLRKSKPKSKANQQETHKERDKLKSKFSSAALKVIASRASATPSTRPSPPAKRQRQSMRKCKTKRKSGVDSESDSDSDLDLNTSSESESEYYHDEGTFEANVEDQVKVETMSDEEELCVVNMNGYDDYDDAVASDQDPLGDPDRASLVKVERNQGAHSADDRTGFEEESETDFITGDIQFEEEDNSHLKMAVKLESLQPLVKMEDLEDNLSDFSEHSAL